MAIAQQKNGQPAEAAKSYQAALDWIKQNDSLVQWWERVETEVLRAEAERLFQEAQKGE